MSDKEEIINKVADCIVDYVRAVRTTNECKVEAMVLLKESFEAGRANVAGQHVAFKYADFEHWMESKK